MPCHSILNEMQDINFKIQGIMNLEKPRIPQLNLTLQSPSVSCLKDQGIDRCQSNYKNQSTAKKAMPQLPKHMASLRFLNPILDEAIAMQQERRRSRSKRNNRNNSQCSIQEEVIEEEQETFIETKHSF